MTDLIGASLPSLPSPGPSMPGWTPAGSSNEEYEETDVEIDSTGTTEIGTVDAARVRVLKVTVDPEESDFDFNVLLDGEDVFSSDESPDAAEEESFKPTSRTGQRAYSPDEKSVEFEVTSASGEADAVADVTVKVQKTDE